MTNLGKVQNVTLWDEGKLETIWFEDENHMRNISLAALIRRNFKIAEVLKKHGYTLQNPHQFDAELQQLHHTQQYYCELCKESTPHDVYVFLGKSVCQQCGELNERFSQKDMTARFQPTQP